MIRSVKLTLEVTCDDGTVLQVPLSTRVSSTDVEDARFLFQVDHTIADVALVRGGLGDIVYEEELLQVLVSKIRMQLDDEDKWPNGKEPKDFLDRLTLMLASQLRMRGVPPPA